MGKTYANKISEVEVSLAIEQFLIADHTQAWAPARIDVDSPPAGFHSLGAVVEDSPKMVYKREKFSLETGIPMVTQFQTTMKMEGSLEATLHSNSWRKIQYALGNYSAISSATVVSTVTSIIAANAYRVTEAESLAVYSQYIFAPRRLSSTSQTGLRPGSRASARLPVRQRSTSRRFR